MQGDELEVETYEACDEGEYDSRRMQAATTVEAHGNDVEAEVQFQGSRSITATEFDSLTRKVAVEADHIEAAVDALYEVLTDALDTDDLFVLVRKTPERAEMSKTVNRGRIAR